jgi:hypothetical protein
LAAGYIKLTRPGLDGRDSLCVQIGADDVGGCFCYEGDPADAARFCRSARKELAVIIDGALPRREELGSWCARCGYDVPLDEQRCCLACGAAAAGSGADEAQRMRRRVQFLERALDDVHRQAEEAGALVWARLDRIAGKASVALLPIDGRQRTTGPEHG